MPYSHGYIPGDRLVDCDECGFTYRRSQIHIGKFQAQKGFWICPKCFDPTVLITDAPMPPAKRPEGRLEDIV